jgi:putative hydrolase of the HAD superfamily
MTPVPTTPVLQPPVRGVIFDFDGTLYALRWHLKPILFAKLLPKGMRLPRFLDARGTCAGADFGSREKLLAAVCEAYAARYRITAHEARRWIDAKFYPSFVWVMRFFRHSRPGLVALLSSLRRRGVRLAVLSDYGRVAQRLDNLRIPASLFDVLASCEDAGALKPNARPFLEVAERLGVPPAETLVVGDRHETDGLAAQAAGMRFLHVTDGWARQGGAVGWNEAKKVMGNI